MGFISHIIALRHMIGSEITSNRYNNYGLCNRSLDADTVQLQNGGRSSDVAQYMTSSDYIILDAAKCNRQQCK